MNPFFFWLILLYQPQTHHPEVIIKKMIPNLSKLYQMNLSTAFSQSGELFKIGHDLDRNYFSRWNWDWFLRDEPTEELPAKGELRNVEDASIPGN